METIDVSIIIESRCFNRVISKLRTCNSTVFDQLAPNFAERVLSVLEWKSRVTPFNIKGKVYG